MKDIKKLFINSDRFSELRKQKLALKKEKSLKFADRVINELRVERNWSWYREMLYRNHDNMDSVALFYRGNEVTYREMFEHMEEYAKSLKTMGIDENTEVPICMSNTPEFVYLLGAISMIGAKANVFANDFDKDYVEEILADCNSDVLFIEDNKYELIKDVIESSHIKRVVMPSLADSLPNGIDPYAEYDKPYKKLFESKVDTYKNEKSNIMSTTDFVDLGREYEGELVNKDVTLDDPFTISYSSGTTSNRPKGIIHSNMSYNGVTRFHDTEINHTPSYRMFSMQATIPTFSSTDLMSGISDALLQGCKLSLEPIYDENFVVESLLINQPSYLDFTKSFWLKFAKDILYNPKYKDVKLPNLAICFSVGEPTELNEEKLINRAFKKVHAGRKLLPVPLPIIKLSVAGGDCEHGGIFYRLLRSYANLNPIHKLKKESAGMGVFDAVDVAVLDENGEHCAPYVVGNLVATSEFDMIGYKNNPQATERFFVKDAQGKTYGDCCVDAYQDYSGYIHFMGRNEKGKVSGTNVSQAILKDVKDVLSCEVVTVGDYFVAHIELVPECRNIGLALHRVNEYCERLLGEEVSEKVLFRLHNREDSFKLTHSGKRDRLSLQHEGISDLCFKPVYQNGDLKIVSAGEYLNDKSNPKVRTYEK